MQLDKCPNEAYSLRPQASSPGFSPKFLGETGGF